MPLSKIDTRGQYTNRITDEDPNSGTRGKLNSEQIQERIELHAKRLINGSPTVQQICNIWWEKYGITMHHQTEKEWALRENNKKAIQCEVERLLSSGEEQVASINDHALVATLAVGAKENATIVKLTTQAIKTLLNEMAVSKEFEQKKQYISLLKGLTSVSNGHSEQLTEMIKLATEVTKKGTFQEAEVRKLAKLMNNAENAQKTKKIEDKNTIPFIETDDLAAAREALEKEQENGSDQQE